jgi:hypothetical protein
VDRSRPLCNDTSLTAERVQIEILRNMPPWRKALQVADDWDSAKALSLAGLRTRYPEASNADLHQHFVRLVLGEELYTQALAARKKKAG